MYKLQAKDSVTGDVHHWTSATRDAAGYPGPNAATELAVVAEHSPGGGGGGSTGTAPATIYVSPSGDDANDGLTEETAIESMIEARKRVGNGDGDVTINIMAAGIYAMDGWENQRRGAGRTVIQSPMSQRQLVASGLEVVTAVTPVPTPAGDDYAIQLITVDATLTPGSLRGMIVYGPDADLDGLDGLANAGQRAVIIDNTDDTITCNSTAMMGLIAGDLLSVGYPTVQLTSNHYRPLYGGKSITHNDQMVLRHVEINADGIEGSSSISSQRGALCLEAVTLNPSRHHNFMWAELQIDGVGARGSYDPETPGDPPNDAACAYVHIQFSRGMAKGYLGRLYLEHVGSGTLYATDRAFYLEGAVGTIGELLHTNLNTNTGFQNFGSINDFEWSSIYRNGSMERMPPVKVTDGAGVLYQLPEVDGTAGQVLSTDGAGNLSWISP